MFSIVGVAVSQPNTGSSAGSFLRIGVSGRTKSMGNAGTANAFGYSAGYDNPAFLTNFKQRNVGVTMLRLDLDRKFTHLAFVSPLKGGGGVSVSWINAGVTDIDSRDTDGNHLEYLSYYDNAFSLGFAVSPVPEKVSVGVNFKVLYGLFPKIKTDNKAIKATGIGFDIGTRIQLPYRFVLGVVLKDLSSKYTWNTDGYWSQGSTKIDKYPVQTQIGVSHTYKYFLITSDVVFSKGKELFRFGSEYTIWNDQWLTAQLRGGMDGSNPTFGMGFRWSMVKEVETSLDYGYIIEQVAPSDTHVLTWMVYFP